MIKQASIALAAGLLLAGVAAASAAGTQHDPDAFKAHKHSPEFYD